MMESIRPEVLKASPKGPTTRSRSPRSLLVFYICRELDCVRRLHSFRKHVEGLEIEKQAELLTSESAAKTEIAKLLKELDHQVART